MIKDFEYFAPKTVEEALSLLSQYKEEAKIIAGGQSMLVVMRQGILAPEYLIDVKGISALDYINYDEREGLRIGALTIHRAIEKSPVIGNGFSVLAEMENNLATIQTRNWGTIGGQPLPWRPRRRPSSGIYRLKCKVKAGKQRRRENH